MFNFGLWASRTAFTAPHHSVSFPNANFRRAYFRIVWTFFDLDRGESGAHSLPARRPSTTLHIGLSIYLHIRSNESRKKSREEQKAKIETKGLPLCLCLCRCDFVQQPSNEPEVHSRPIAWHALGTFHWPRSNAIEVSCRFIAETDRPINWKHQHFASHRKPPTHHFSMCFPILCQLPIK